MTIGHMTFGLWDALLLVSVSAMATILAYLHHPRWKAFMITLPIPFTISALALGKPLGTANVVAVIVLLLYTHAVRLLYYGLKLPIIAAIVLSAAGYCLAGLALAPVLPNSNIVFWPVAAAVFLLGVILYRYTPSREEPGYRSQLPIWLKLPLVMVVVLFLIVVKQSLQGFITMFPMVGVIAAYESRHSLWTLGRQIPVLMLTCIPLIVVSRSLTHAHQCSLGASLLAGWIVFLAVLIPLMRELWHTPVESPTQPEVSVQ